MTRLPSEEEIRKEIRETFKVHPQLMRCITCRHYAKITSFCNAHQRNTFPYVPACGSYESNDEMLLREVIMDLQERERECELSELLINLQPTTALAATMMGEHHISVLKTMLKKEKDEADKRKLKKDVATLEEITEATKRMVRSMDNIKEKWYKCLRAFEEEIQKDMDSIDAQYRQYIQRYVDKTFYKKGKYNDKLYTQLLSNAGDFSLAILDKVRKSYEDEGQVCPLNDKDFKRYMIKK
jgi:flagellar biosynthesis GTPase FlhF